MKYAGIAECFFINGLSFIPIIAGIAMITVPGAPRKRDRESNILKEIKSGLLYSAHNEKIFPTFLILAVVSTFALNTNVILPVFAKDVLKGDESTYSLMMSMFGVGALGGALFMAGIGRKIRNKYFLVSAAFAICILEMLTLLGLNSTLYSAILLIGIGFLMLCFLNRANTRVQLNTDDDYRGRVMSIYVMIVTGSTPIGNSLTGLAMDTIGESYGYFINGAFTFVVVAVLFYTYRRKLVKARVVESER